MIPAHIAAWKMKKTKGSGRKQEDANMPGEMNDRRTVRAPIPNPVAPGVRPPGGWRDSGGSTNPAPPTHPPAPEGYEYVDVRRGGRGEDIRQELRAKGGGGYQPVDPMEQAKADILLEQEKDRIADDNAAAAKAAKDAADAATRTQAGKANTAAYGSAKTYGQNQVNNQGFNAGLVDKYNVLDMYYGDLDTQKGGIDPMDTTPTYNTNTSLANAISSGTNAYRNDTTKAINAFTGSGFENNLIADTMDDTILNAIIGKQFGDTQTQIKSAWERGQLNDVGYAKALDELATANTAGLGQLQNIGGGVLSGYRTGLTGKRNEALSTASGLTLADLYDMDAYKKSINSAVSGYGNSLEGDIYSAVGDQQFFDPNKLIAGAGAGQGFYNPSQPAPIQTTKQTGTSPLTGLLEEEAKRNLSSSSVV